MLVGMGGWGLGFQCWDKVLMFEVHLMSPGSPNANSSDTMYELNCFRELTPPQKRQLNI